MNLFKLLIITASSLLVFFCLQKKTIEQSQSTQTVAEKKGDGPENPLEREQWRLSRKGGSIDPQTVWRSRITTQRLYNQKMSKSNSRDGGIGAWSELGPASVGGRIRSIALHPTNTDKIFVGSVGGGIWQSTDNGASWNQVNDFMNSLSVTQILYDPFNSNTMYASTGEGYQILGTGGNTGQQGTGGALSGVGIFKSTNGGTTWDLLPTPPNENFFWVNDIAVDPNNQDWIYAVTTDAPVTNSPSNSTNQGKIFKSIDGGNNWSLLASTNSAGLDIKIDPNNSDNILVGCGDNLYRSTNATNSIQNITFTSITGGPNQMPQPINGQRIEICYAPSVVDMIYASFNNSGSGSLYRSIDGGDTWTLRSTLASHTALWYANTLWVDPFLSTVLVWGSIDLYKSIDGGVNFTILSDWRDDIGGSVPSDPDGDGINNSAHADHHVFIEASDYHPTNNPKIYNGNDGGIYSSDDFSTLTQNSGWTSLVNNLAITQFYGGAISDDGTLIGGGAQDNSYCVSNDSGTSWVQPTTGDGAYFQIAGNGTVMYANTNYNSIWQSFDQGVTWDRIANFRWQCPPTTGCFCCDPPPANPGGPCSVPRPAGCFNLTNTFFAINDNPALISLFKLDPNNSNILVVGATRLWRNNNAGMSDAWTAIKGNIGGGARVSAIEIDLGNSARIWTGYDNGQLERTTDTGSTWSGNISPSSLPPSPFVTDIATNPSNSNEVIVSYGGYNTNNLFYTSNGNNASPTWNNINLGFDTQINSITWHPTNSNWIYVGTDFGIFASEDKGVTWSANPLYSQNEGPVYTEVSDLFWQGNTNRLCAATHGRGIWRSNILRSNIYIDKTTNVPTNQQDGTISAPFKKLTQALTIAENGTEIIYLSAGAHDEVATNSQILFDKSISIKLLNGAIIID